MSNKLFQGLIYQMREAVDREIGIIDDKGVVIACTRIFSTSFPTATKLSLSAITPTVPSAPTQE